MIESELDKWSNVHEEWVKFNEFLDWLRGKYVYLFKYGGTAPYPLNEEEVYRFFCESLNIDYDKLEQERRELLESVSSHQ